MGHPVRSNDARVQEWLKACPVDLDGQGNTLEGVTGLTIVADMREALRVEVRRYAMKGDE